jgi:hypothetical protein
MSAQQQQPFVQSGEPLNVFLRKFWQRQVDAAEQETPDYRHPPLPLARIKKVMKSDPDVKVCALDADWPAIVDESVSVVDDCCRWYVSKPPSNAYWWHSVPII